MFLTNYFKNNQTELNYFIEEIKNTLSDVKKLVNVPSLGELIISLYFLCSPDF